MTRAEAHEKGREVFKESFKKEEEIIKEAKANGTWQMGLDSNRHLFKELHTETMEKIRKLEEMIDEE